MIAFVKFFDYKEWLKKITLA